MNLQFPTPRKPLVVPLSQLTAGETFTTTLDSDEIFIRDAGQIGGFSLTYSKLQSIDKYQQVYPVRTWGHARREFESSVKQA